MVQKWQHCGSENTVIKSTEWMRQHKCSESFFNPLTPNAAFDQLTICLFTFSARFFCLSAAQNAPPAGGRPAGGAFCAADKQKKRAEKVNKLASRLQCKIFMKQLGVKGLILENVFLSSPTQ